MMVMTSTLEIVAAATSAATKGWKPARQAAPGAAGTGSAVSGADQLVRLIEADIMPRLMASHRAGDQALDARPFTSDQLRRFALVLIDDDIGPALGMMEQLLATGHTAPALMEALIAPAIRLLGDKWLADDIDFVDVTMAAWRCQQLVHALSARQPGPAPLPGSPRRALILPAPGEQHVLGAMLVDDAFRRAGWATRGGAALDEDGLIALVAREAFDVIGLSVSCTSRLPTLARTLATLRRMAVRPPLLLLGGPALADCRDPAALGADAIAASAAAAVELAERGLQRHSALARESG